MKKKFLVTIMAATLILSSSIPALAAEKASNGYDTREATITDLKADPVPVFEGSRTLSSFSALSTSATTPRLVASDVQQIYSGFGAYTYAWGYTDVKSGTTDYYHYSRAEVQSTASVIATSGNVWGYGHVEAESTDAYEGIHNNYTARIFYGW